MRNVDQPGKLLRVYRRARRRCGLSKGGIGVGLRRWGLSKGRIGVGMRRWGLSNDGGGEEMGFV